MIDVRLSKHLIAEAMKNETSVKEKINNSNSFLSIAYITQYFDP